VNRNLSEAKLLDFRSIHVNAQNMISRVRKAGAGYEADIAGPKNGYSHQEQP
jgi:hypothetical protein